MGLLKQNVFLVGFMGVGKTTVGRRLARDLGVAFIDVDAYLHRRYGKDATSLFKQRGEAGLRRAETKALAECADMGPAVISCGEGIVASQRARELLRTRGCAVWLESSAEASLARIKNLRTRPLLAQGCDTDKLWAARRPLYEEVSIARVCVADISTGQAARAIETVLKEAGVYDPASGGESSQGQHPVQNNRKKQGGQGRGNSRPTRASAKKKPQPANQGERPGSSQGSRKGASSQETGQPRKRNGNYRRRRRRRAKSGASHEQGKVSA